MGETITIKVRVNEIDDPYMYDNDASDLVRLMNSMGTGFIIAADGGYTVINLTKAIIDDVTLDEE